MAGERHFTIAITVLILVAVTAAGSVPATAAPGEDGDADADVDFIRASCRVTRYPSLCFQSLQIFAPTIKRSPRQLTVTAIAVSVSRARVAAGYVGRLANDPSIRGRDAGAVKDCVENMADSVDRLGDSMKTTNMAAPGTGGFNTDMDNVKAWASAALTDENTCLDGLAGVRNPAVVGMLPRLENVLQVTSNALALINSYAHDAGREN